MAMLTPLRLITARPDNSIFAIPGAIKIPILPGANWLAYKRLFNIPTPNLLKTLMPVMGDRLPKTRANQEKAQGNDHRPTIGNAHQEAIHF